MKIINCISAHYNVSPSDEIRIKSKHPGVENVLKSNEISGMYAQMTVEAMQEFREEHKNAKTKE